MPAATDERIVKVTKFTGLNQREPAEAIDDHELSDVLNFDLAENGELVKRTGWTRKATVTIAVGDGPFFLLGLYQTSAITQLIGAKLNNAGDSVIYTSGDGVIWTNAGTITGKAEYGVQYVDVFYIVRSSGPSGLISWDGAVFASIAGAPSGTFGRVFKDRLFICNTISTSTASRLYFSKPFDFSATGWPATNYIDVGAGDGDWLIGCWNLQDTLIVFKSSSAWTLYVQGDTTLWILRPFNSEIGCISKYTFSVLENVLYFVGIRGVYVTDGNSIRNVSIPISPAFDNVVVSQTLVNRTSAFLWEDKYVVSLEAYSTSPSWNAWTSLTWNALLTQPWAGGNATYAYYVYHIRYKGWTKWAPVTLQPHIFVGILLSSTMKGIWSGDRAANGYVLKWGERVYQDDGSNFEVAAETKEFDFGLPTEFKRGKWIGVEQRSEGTHQFIETADGNVRVNVVVTTHQQNEVLKILGPGYFRAMRIRSSATHSNPVTLYGYAFHLSTRGRIKAQT